MIARFDMLPPSKMEHVHLRPSQTDRHSSIRPAFPLRACPHGMHALTEFDLRNETVTAVPDSMSKITRGSDAIASARPPGGPPDRKRRALMADACRPARDGTEPGSTSPPRRGAAAAP